LSIAPIVLNLLSKDGQFSNEDLKRLQYGDRELKKGEKVKSLDQFMHDMSAYTASNPYRIKQVKERLDGFMRAHAHLPTISRQSVNGSSNSQKYQLASLEFQAFEDYAENNADYVKQTSDLARTELLRRGFNKNYVDLAIDKNTGRTRSSEEFLTLWEKKYGSPDLLKRDQEIYDPSKGKTVMLTNKNYNEVINRIGTHLLDVSSVGTNTARFYENNTDAKNAIQGALGTNEGVDAVYITKEGRRLSINDDRDKIKSLMKSNKSYLIKNTQAGGWFSDTAFEIREVDKSADRNKIIKDLGDGYVFNLWTNPKKDVNSKAVNAYSDIKKELNDVYTSSDIMKVPIPTSGNNPINPGTGLSAQSSVIQVLPLNRNAPGTQAMFDIFRELETLDFDGMSSVISFTGSDATSIKNSQITDDQVEEGTWRKTSSTAKGKTLLRELQQAMLNPSVSKVKAFDIEYQSIAGGSLDNESIIIRPTREFLKEYRETKEGNDLLTGDDLINLTEHGLNMIVPSGTFNNTLSRASITSPFDSNVQYKSAQGIPTVYNDVYGNGSVSIDHDRQNDNYVITMRNSNMGLNESYVEPISRGKERFYEAISLLDLLSQQNSNIKN
jgi:hypothetical protein